MSLSSFCVVMNALRLNLFSIRNKKEPEMQAALKAGPVPGKENTMSDTRERVIKVDGMMCGHCEMHVKKALEALDGVTEASASHEKGQVLLKLAKAVADADLEKAVADAGYTFRG